MLAVFTFLLVLAMSLVVVRVATVGLTLTGISKDLAEFQALSAFTRSGFTTRESEEIVNHPVRRRIAMVLMLTGNAGVVIYSATLLLSFLGVKEDGQWYTAAWVRFLIISLGVFVLWCIARSRIVEHAMWNVNSWAVQHWTRLEVHDYMGLLRVSGDYAVCELQVREGDWLEDRTLIELQLPREGVLVLGIERADGHYLGAPKGITKIQLGDTLILYGRQETLKELDTRRAGMLGNMHHVIAVTKQMDFQDVAPEGDQEAS